MVKMKRSFKKQPEPFNFLTKKTARNWLVSLNRTGNGMAIKQPFDFSTHSCDLKSGIRIFTIHTYVLYYLLFVSGTSQWTTKDPKTGHWIPETFDYRTNWVPVIKCSDHLNTRQIVQKALCGLITGLEIVCFCRNHSVTWPVIKWFKYCPDKMAAVIDYIVVRFILSGSQMIW
jgi:hypothetical protein